MKAMIGKSKKLERPLLLGLPKFKLQFEKNLRETFEKMGMTDMFSLQRAKLNKISDEPELHVSGIVHKTFLEVNEEGTEACALTSKTLN